MYSMVGVLVMQLSLPWVHISFLSTSNNINNKTPQINTKTYMKQQQAGGRAACSRVPEGVKGVV